MKDHFAIETIETTMISDLGNIHFRTPRPSHGGTKRILLGPKQCGIKATSTKNHKRPVHLMVRILRIDQHLAHAKNPVTSRI